MSDYHHGKSMTECPHEDCFGEDCARGTYQFECDECGLQFP